MTVTSAGRSTGTDKNAANGSAANATRDAQRKDRQQAVEAAILTIEKQFGQGSIMRLGSDERQQIDSIPTGSIALDLALGVGGVPRGRITEIFGPESSGKTTVCQHVLAEAQRLGGVVAFIDVEHALDPQYARACGVDVNNLLVSQPDTGEQALEITETLIRSGGVDCVVVDSVAALVPRAEIEGEMGDSFVGIQARLMSQALRKLTGIVSRSNTALVFTNQLREKIGVMFGNPEVTPGGRALKFYASVRLDIRRIETITNGSEAVGIRVRVKVVKNKVAAPFRVAEFDVMYGSGISREGGLLDVGVASDVVRKSGAWFNYGETRLGQGREQSKEFLRTNPDIAQRLETEIRAKVATIDVPVEGIKEAE
jgi:recombination protein RecA